MIKHIILVVTSLWMVACSAHDGRYYSLHPKTLQKAITECPKKQPAGMSCDQLKNIASRVNELAYQLRLDPQGYGKEILTLQELIGKQETTVSKSANKSELQPSIIENKRELAERIAIVKWLESPTGA